MPKKQIYLNPKKINQFMRREGLLESLVITLIASLVLIIMGTIYFIATLLIVRFSTGLMGYSPDANWIILSSAVIVTGVMVGSAIKNA
jgi:ABC-type antimicrobial peptide transport system permease subunit